MGGDGWRNDSASAPLEHLYRLLFYAQTILSLNSGMSLNRCKLKISRITAKGLPFCLDENAVWAHDEYGSKRLKGTASLAKRSEPGTMIQG